MYRYTPFFLFVLVAFRFVLFCFFFFTTAVQVHLYRHSDPLVLYVLHFSKPDIQDHRFTEKKTKLCNEISKCLLMHNVRDGTKGSARSCQTVGRVAVILHTTSWQPLKLCGTLHWT